MKPMICPQCGGKVTEHEPRQNSVVCGYCDTKLIVPPEREQRKEDFTTPTFSPKTSSANSLGIVAVVVGLLFFGGFIFILVLSANKNTSTPPKFYPKAIPTPSVSWNFPSPTPTPKLNLLEFGGKGTSEGLFDEAVTVALDAEANIYVGDESLRVQQFDAKGKFLKLWQIPSSTVNYKRARTIQKIAVGENKRLFVLVGGVILIYEANATEPSRAIHFAPEAIQDFALRADGGILAVVNYGDVEVLAYLNRGGKVVRRLEGFHTDAAEAAISPYSTGVASIRLAVDGAGNIFSIFALGDLGSYQVSMNTEDFLIFRFTPEGKYVNKFYQTSDSCGIAVDGQNRLYISERDAVVVISAKDATRLGSSMGLGSIRAFALDKENNIYVINSDNIVVKRAPPI